MTARILILGIGNPGRGDDGLGPAAAAAIARMALPSVTTSDPYQLAIEDAADIAEHDVIWFVDATMSGIDPYTVDEIHPATEIGFTSHVLSPHTVLGIARDYFSRTPRAFLLAIRGYNFAFSEALTPQAAENLADALAMLTRRLRDTETEP